MRMRWKSQDYEKPNLLSSFLLLFSACTFDRSDDCMWGSLWKISTTIPRYILTELHRGRMTSCRPQSLTPFAPINVINDIQKTVWAGNPGLLVMGWDSQIEGRGFESQQCILDWHFFTWIFFKNCNGVCLKNTENEGKKRPGLGAFFKKKLSLVTNCAEAGFKCPWWEPCSSDYGRWLKFKRLWVRIPYIVYWMNITFFTFCVVKIVLFVRKH